MPPSSPSRRRSTPSSRSPPPPGALADTIGPTRTVERELALRGHGTTGLAAALHAAHVQLAGARARRRVTVLLSDCRVTDEVDALPAARTLDELVILAPAGDDAEARRLAQEAGARIAAIASVLDVPAALNRLLADDRV